MNSHQAVRAEVLTYRSGLDRVEEQVVSSHFMHRFCTDSDLNGYEIDEFSEKSRYISIESVSETLLPALLEAAQAGCLNRLPKIKSRAKENFAQYGLRNPEDVRIEHFIAEVMFDRTYSKASKKYYSRSVLAEEVLKRVESRLPIKMVIPALPFKISSPLKSRGRLPDLAEVNFILQLYEIAFTIDLLYRSDFGDGDYKLAEFSVVSDGSRFSALVGEPNYVVQNYRLQLANWIERLGIAAFIKVYDYESLLRERLDPVLQLKKSEIFHASAREYGDLLWPIFDPLNAGISLRMTAQLEPDPESGNPEGRFASLLKSLVYTINYKSLDCGSWTVSQSRQLYRELTGHLFDPYVRISAEDSIALTDCDASWPLSERAKEALRQSMLQEVWNATILYMAEIKSDRELEDEPILTCLPDHFRWTIHAKLGQLAIAVPTALGLSVQAWAGAAVFKQAKKGKIRLCTLPVLALEGAGATPVRVQDEADSLGLGDQPLFYIYPDVPCGDISEFLATLRKSLTRERSI